MGIKFLHTADWHIGDAFKSIGGEAAVLLSHERFSMVERIARLAGTEQADVVLVAGDIFDYNVGNETFHKLINAMRHFAGAWVLIPGNHDSACAGSIWKRLDSLTVPANVHCVTEPGILQLKNGEIHILCAPLQYRHESRDTTAEWPSLDTPVGSYRIGLAHGGAARLPGLRVASVDKFQGQEAPVVIYSMAASSAEECPRGMDFLFNRNRTNVAISRAKALAIVVASPELARVHCSGVEQMSLANLFCRVIQEGSARGFALSESAAV